MSKTNPVGRVVEWVLGPPVEWIGWRVEQRVRREMLPVPQLPWWAVPVTVAVAMVGTVAAHVEDGDGRTERERAEPEPTATAERGTTSARDGEAVRGALETLEVAPPPLPEPEDVRASYRRLTLETHPDQGGTVQEFIEVREAWETLSQPEGLSGTETDERGN